MSDESIDQAVEQAWKNHRIGNLVDILPPPYELHVRDVQDTIWAITVDCDGNLRTSLAQEQASQIIP